MSNKTSKIVVLIATLGAAYIGASWWLGKQVEARYAVLMDRAVTQFGPDIFVERHYERGLFSSTSSVVMQFDWAPIWQDAALDEDEAASAGEQSMESSAVPAEGAPPPESTPNPAPKNPAQKIRLTFQDDIRHGPLLPGTTFGAARIQTRLIKVDGADDATRQMFAKVKPPEFDTLAGFDGTFSGQARLPAGEMTDPKIPDNTAQWQELVYDYRYSTDASHIEGSVRWPQFTLHASSTSSDNGEGAVALRMDGLKSDFDITQVGERWLFVPGHSNGALDAVALSYRGEGQSDLKSILDLKNLKYENTATSQNQLMNSTGTIIGEGRIGGLALKEIRLESQIQRVSETGLMAVQKMLAKTKSETQDQEVEKFLNELDDTLRQLLKGQPEYRFSLNATTPDDQTAKLNYHITLSEDKEGSDKKPWMITLRQRLSADVDLRLPKAWLPTLADLVNNPDVTPEIVTDLAQTLAQQGLIVEEGDAYVAKAQVGNNQINLNGKPLFGGGMGMGRQTQ